MYFIHHNVITPRKLQKYSKDAVGQVQEEAAGPAGLQTRS